VRRTSRSRSESRTGETLFDLEMTNLMQLYDSGPCAGR
jgi:hypothetical protein